MQKATRSIETKMDGESDTSNEEGRNACPRMRAHSQLEEKNMKIGHRKMK